MKDLIKKLKKIKGKNVLVISHESPDGDAIGSIIGFSYLLKSLGANVLTINKDGVPVKYLFLEKDIKVRTLDGLSDIEKNREYVVFILDSANLERIGFNLDEVFSNISEVYNIDHHISNKFFADNNYVYPDKAATCEIVGSLYLDIEGFVPADAATAIYVGVMTDTGNLTYEATSTATVALISILMEMGADYNKARREIYEKSSVGQIEGLKGVLNNLKVSEDGLVAYTYLPFSII